MILSGNEIRKQIELGNITVDPFDNATINPASIDLTLGHEVAVYEDFTSIDPPGLGGQTLQPLTKTTPLDTKKPSKLRKWIIDPEDGWIINPGIGYLMHTAEKVHTDKFVPVLDGKSSIGRLFVQVHFTAGYGDAGFFGQYTLEVSSLFPVRVYPGMRICQMRFVAIQGEVTLYGKAGHYVGKYARGAVGSRVWEQFQSGNSSPVDKS